MPGYKNAVKAAQSERAFSGRTTVIYTALKLVLGWTIRPITSLSMTKSDDRRRERRENTASPVVRAIGAVTIVTVATTIVSVDAQANDIFGFPCDPNAGLIDKIGFFIQGVVFAAGALIALAIIGGVFRQSSRNDNGVGDAFADGAGEVLLYGVGAISCAFGGVFFASSQCTSSLALTAVPLEEEIGKLAATGAGLLGVFLIVLAFAIRPRGLSSLVWGVLLLIVSALALFVLSILKEGHYKLSERGFREQIAKAEAGGSGPCTDEGEIRRALLRHDYEIEYGLPNRSAAGLRPDTIAAIIKKGGFILPNGKAFKVLCGRYSDDLRVIRHPPDHRPDYPKLDTTGNVVSS